MKRVGTDSAACLCFDSALGIFIWSTLKPYEQPAENNDLADSNQSIITDRGATNLSRIDSSTLTSQDTSEQNFFTIQLLNYGRSILFIDDKFCALSWWLADRALPISARFRIRHAQCLSDHLVNFSIYHPVS